MMISVLNSSDGHIAVNTLRLAVTAVTVEKPEDTINVQ
jgi:hypothetical protein